MGGKVSQKNDLVLAASILPKGLASQETDMAIVPAASWCLSMATFCIGSPRLGNIHLKQVKGLISSTFGTPHPQRLRRLGGRSDYQERPGCPKEAGKDCRDDQGMGSPQEKEPFLSRMARNNLKEWMVQTPRVVDNAGGQPLTISGQPDSETRTHSGGSSE